MLSRVLVPLTLICSATLAHAAPNFQFLDDEAEPGGYDVTATVSAPGQIALSRQKNGDGYTLQVAANALELDLTHGGVRRDTERRAGVRLHSGAFARRSRAGERNRTVAVNLLRKCLCESGGSEPVWSAL